MGLDLPRALTWPLPRRIQRVRPMVVSNLLLVLTPLSPLEKQVLYFSPQDTSDPQALRD